MKIPARFAVILSVSSLLCGPTLFAQRGAAGPNLDHEEMLAKLGITTPLRPGPRGQDVNAPNYANYDESKATSKSPVPPLLATGDGRRITTAAQWQERRKELFEIFDREFYGRLPAAAKTIKVTWEVTGTTQGMSGDIPTITRTLVGHVDPTYYPAITVDIAASVTTPANAAGKVPVIIVWGGGGGGAPGAARGGRGPVTALPALPQLQAALNLSEAQVAAIRPLLEKAQQDLAALPAPPPAAPSAPAPAGGADAAAALRATLIEKISAQLTDAQKPLLAATFAPAAGRGPGLGARAGGPPAGAAPGGGRGPAANTANNPPFPNGATSWQQAAISLGWGYGNLNPASIQADSGGENLRKGIIGFINKGQSRKPDDWGALRAWAWGAGKLIDFFETDSLVDARQVAFEGHSRYGKATLATLVYEPRALTGYVSSSGEGGAKLWRHLVGEQVESLAGTSEYHWMAGNFLKYAGPLTVDDLPADAHQFIALVAPRPIFIGGGEYVEFNGAPGHPESRYSGESWQDTPGTFMATAGASPVWKLLGGKPLANDALGLRFDDVPNPRMVKIPPPLTPLIDGDIAFRQHDQGHTDGPNWSTFIEFARHHFKSPGFKK
jgi:hypothetical protein